MDIFSKIPLELFEQICSYLRIEQILRLSQISKQFRIIVANIIQIEFNKVALYPKIESIYKLTKEFYINRDEHSLYDFYQGNYTNLLINAAEAGHIEFVRVLLNHPEVDPTAFMNDALCMSALNGHLDIVKLLLADPRITPTFNLVENAINANKADVILIFVKDARIDEIFTTQFVLDYATSNNLIDVVKLILANPCTIIHNMSMYIIFITAVKKNYIDIVRLFLKDKRIGSEQLFNDALVISVTKDDNTITKILLADKRIDPSINNNAVIKEAANRYNNRVIRLLLRDSRVRESKDLEDISLSCYASSITKKLIRNVIRSNQNLKKILFEQMPYA